jgi:regulatory protein
MDVVSRPRSSWHRGDMARRGGDPPPDEAALHEAALSYLARYGATRATLARVLDRRVGRWARANPGEETASVVAAARRAVRELVEQLAASGAVDDTAFARARARRLTRSGRSRRATAAHLAARGVAGEAVKAALPDDAEADFAAAVAFTRRRRLGPFRRAEIDADGRRRELAALARAGFTHDTANRALSLAPDEAEAVLARLRQE